MGISTRRWVFGVVTGWLLAIGVSGTGPVASEQKTISDLEVRSEEGLTRIILRGAEDPIYTAFMRDNPPRLIIDLPDVVFDGVETPIQVGDGVVSDITLGAFGDPRVAATMARVSVGLSASTEYQVIPKGTELVIELRSQGAPAPVIAQPAPEAAQAPVAPPDPDPSAGLAEAETDGSAQTPEEAFAPPEDVFPEPSPSETAPEPAPGEAPEQATQEPAPAPTAATGNRITHVSAQGSRIELVADGPIDNVDSFALEEPDRIVLDLWGLSNGVSPPRFATNGGPVERVRIGEHPDKVRVVLDLGQAVSSHTVVPTPKGAVVTLVTDGPPEPETVAEEGEPWPEAEETEDRAPEDWVDVEETDGADSPGEDAFAEDLGGETVEPEAAATSEEPVEVADSAEVESVHFESLGEVDRVVVTLSARLDVELVQPDPATVIVEMPGAIMQPEDERRVITAEFGGPIEVFSAFRTPEIEGDHVRLVVKRRGGAKPRLVWEGQQLWLEIRRSGLAMTPLSPEFPASEEAAAMLPSPLTPPGAPLPMATSPSATAPASAPAPIGPRESPYTGPANPASIDILEEGGFTQQKEYLGRRISLDFKDADIGNILRLIAEVSDLNVIAGEEVTGTVTIRLVDVPWDQALDIILLTKGLGFVRIGNILRIAPVEVLQREEQARLQERRAKEKLEDLVVKLQPVNYADVEEVGGLVKRLLSARGTVNVDKRTSTLIIKDIPSVIHEATALVKAIDTQTPQVLIEAKIVEASLDFSRSLGARWAAGIVPRADPNDFIGGEDLHLDTGLNNFVFAPPGLTSVGALTLGLLGINDRLQLDLVIQAAESNSKGKVISSPRVVTLDNREATIQQGVAIRFDASDGDSVSTSFVDAVLELAVTPHITADRSIIMEIKVSRNAPEIGSSAGDVVGIAKNETQTEALVRDGQTMVLGGIYTVDSSTGSERMPFLSDIPIIGAAFRTSDKQDVRRELLIFVTPRIVEGLAPAS